MVEYQQQYLGTWVPVMTDSEVKAMTRAYGPRFKVTAKAPDMATFTVSGSATTDLMFSSWTADVTTSTTDQIWVTWTDDSTGSTYANNANHTYTEGGAVTINYDTAWTTHWAPSAYDKAERTKRKLLQRRKDKPAKEKALELLESILDEDQWADWKRHNSVRVRGSEGGLYEIGCGWAGMIYKLDPETEEPIQKLCCHPPSHYPVGDRVATLVLALENDEQAILAKANVHSWAGEHEKERVRLRRAHRAAG